MTDQADVQLTLSQRLHFDIYGFVMLRGVLNPDEIARLNQALQLAKTTIESGTEIPPIYFHRDGDHHILLGNLVHYNQDKFHCVFVKTLAYLTDVGPDDGGTSLIPGSHRLTWQQSRIIKAAMADDGLLYQVEAKAGDVILFAESLIHSTTEIRSDNERTILVAGYTPTMFQPWPGNEVDPDFIDSLPEDIQPIISGSGSWHWERNY